MTDQELRIYAATVLGEAEGEGDFGMRLVAWVVRHRVERPRYPDSIIGVCFAPLQFSIWNGDSHRRAELLTAEDDAHWSAAALCIDVWTADRDDDPTIGADHYFNPKLADPSWQHSMRKVEEYGNHVFYDSRREA